MDCMQNMISKEALEKFKALYKSHFNIDLTDQEALEKRKNKKNEKRQSLGGAK